jgi:hypothetical protein
MQILAVEVKITIPDESYLTLTYTPTKEGIKIQQKQALNSTEFKCIVPLTDVSQTWGDHDSIVRHFSMLLDVYGFESMELNVESSMGHIICKTWDLEKLKVRHKEIYDNSDEDADVSVAQFHFSSVIKSIISQLRKPCLELEKMEKVKNTECPILHEPLKADCIWLKKCDHFVSKEAWSKINWKREAGDTESYKPCPLCRCKYEHAFEWE